jgi:hypothetical protein
MNADRETARQSEQCRPSSSSDGSDKAESAHDVTSVFSSIQDSLKDS